MCPVVHIFSFDLDTYTFFYLIAGIVAYFLLKHEWKRNHYPPYLYTTLMGVGLTTGLIGSKMYSCFEVWDEFVANPFDIFFDPAGLGWYGGFILGSISIIITLKIKKLPILKTLDIMIPIIPISQVLGRLGCFLAGDGCYGTPSNVLWAMSFPNGLVPTFVKVHPTPLYEMFIYFCIFILLWKLRKREMRKGLKFSLYLILAGLGRFVVEFYRLNPKVLFWLTVPQIIAILGVMLGVFIIIGQYAYVSSLRLNFAWQIERRCLQL